MGELEKTAADVLNKAAAERIAPFCHEANRIITSVVKDVPVQPPWEDAPEDMKKSSIQGVLFALENPNATPEEQFKDWKKNKIADGWTYGPTRDNKAKIHPSLVDNYDQLSDGTKAKDSIFQLIVKAMT